MTIQAEEDCEVLVFEGHLLDRVYEVCPKLSLIIDCLVGKDITRKLYCTSDLANIIVNNKLGNSQYARSMSIAPANFGKGETIWSFDEKFCFKVFPFLSSFVIIVKETKLLLISKMLKAIVLNFVKKKFLMTNIPKAVRFDLTSSTNLLPDFCLTFQFWVNFFSGHSHRHIVTRNGTSGFDQSKLTNFV